MSQTKLLVYPAIIFVGLLMIFSCEDNPTTVDLGGTNPNYDGRVIGYVHGVVTDAVTGTILVGVIITYSRDGVLYSTVTNPMGMYAIGNLPEGMQEFSYNYVPDTSENDYAISTANVNVVFVAPDTIIYGNSNEDYHVSFTRDVQMFPMNAGITGTIYAMPNTAFLYPAVGAEVVLDYANYPISVSEIRVETNSDGVFIFENIPATPDVNIMVLPFIDGDYNYGVAMATENLIPGGMVIADNISLDIAGAEPVVINNNFTEGFASVDQNLILTFSKPMNTETFDVFLLRGIEDVTTLESWDSAGIILTVDPVTQLMVNAAYSLEILASSLDENDFHQIFNFQTIEGIEVISTNLLEFEGIPVIDFPLDENIEMTFSREVNVNYPYNVLDLIDSGDTTSNVSATLTWEENNTKAVVHPLMTLKRNTNYTFTYNVYSTYIGDNVADNINFTTIDEGIEIDSTNLEDIYGDPVEDFSLDGNIIIYFSQSANPDNEDNIINLDNQAGMPIFFLESWTEDNTVLTIDPLLNLAPNTTYCLQFMIYSTVINDFVNGNYLFTTFDDTPIPGDVQEFTLDMPEGWAAYWNTVHFNFSWRTQSEVDEYILYANDDLNNPQWVELNRFNAISYLFYQSAGINLPAEFDLYVGDPAGQTPLSGGINVSFAIIASNHVGESGLASATVIVVEDETAPEPTLVQNGTAYNPNPDSSLTFTINFQFDIEYCNASIQPVFGFIEAFDSSLTGDSLFVLPNDAVTWEWDNDSRNGTFTIVVPADLDGSGDLFYCTRVTDNSGNMQSDTSWVQPWLY